VDMLVAEQRVAYLCHRAAQRLPEVAHYAL
jgi:hypothetical protein